MIPMTLADLSAAIGAPCESELGRTEVRRVVIDSRDVRRGDVFVALRGQRVDGHQFVSQAADAGAVASIVCRGVPLPVSDAPASAPRLVVDDPLVALGRLAATVRRRFISRETIVVAVTGSNGKTTTKCMLDHVLGSSLPGRASPKSFNNALGVPLTLLSAEPNDRYLVAEVGTNAPGEIAALASMIVPHVAVITSIGEAHLQGLGSVSAVAAEKASLMDAVEPGGLAVVNVDSPEIIPHLTRQGRIRLMTVGFGAHAKLRATPLDASIHKTTFMLDGRFRVELPMPGVHHATNAAATFAVARWFGLSTDDIINRLATFKPPQGRTRVLDLDGVIVIDDAYNANPSSVGRAIEALTAVPARRRVFVLGDMLELGEGSAAHHERMIRSALTAGVDVLVGVGAITCAAGRKFAESDSSGRVCFCENREAALDGLRGLMRPGDVVWIKASRGMELDRLVAELESPPVSEAAVA